jgi:hypothetical protein
LNVTRLFPGSRHPAGRRESVIALRRFVAVTIIFIDFIEELQSTFQRSGRIAPIGVSRN